MNQIINRPLPELEDLSFYERLSLNKTNTMIFFLTKTYKASHGRNVTRKIFKNINLKVASAVFN